MKIKQQSLTKPKLVTLCDLDFGGTYRDITTGNIWLCAVGGYVNLTTDRMVTRNENMPGGDSTKVGAPRYEEVECILEIKEV